MTDDEVRLWRDVYLRAFPNLEMSPLECATAAVREFRRARQQLALEADGQGAYYTPRAVAEVAIGSGGMVAEAADEAASR